MPKFKSSFKFLVNRYFLKILSQLPGITVLVILTKWYLFLLFNIGANFFIYCKIYLFEKSPFLLLGVGTITKLMSELFIVFSRLSKITTLELYLFI